MASYDDLADLMPSASPLASAGIDPDDAVANREQVMAQLAAKQNGMTHPVANTSGTIPELVAAAPTPSWLSGATAPAAAPKGPPATNAPTPASEPPSAPSVPGVVTPSGNSSTPTPNYYQAGQAGALDSATAAQGNARRWQSRPLPSATTDPIEDKIEAASTPTQGRDAQGNLLPQYRPSVGQRIVRGVQGFAQNGLRGVLTAPYGAPNDAYQGQEAQRQAQLAAMRQRLQYRQGANAADQTALKGIDAADTNVGSRFSSIANGAVSKQNADTTANTLAQQHARAVSDAIAAGRDPATDPKVSVLADQITGLQKPAAGGTKTVQLEVGGKPHQVLIDEKTGAPIKDLGESGEKPATVNVNAGEAALDREAKQFGSPHQKSLDASNSQLEKIADARSMINGNAEAQGLGIPKVLTALVGGQGTGVRITQAELTSIAHARGLTGDVEGTLNKWAGKGALSSEQQRQLTQIMDDVKVRLQQKQSIAKDALDTINGATSREQIVAADKAARQKISDMEKGSSDNGAPPPGAKVRDYTKLGNQ